MIGDIKILSVKTKHLIMEHKLSYLQFGHLRFGAIIILPILASANSEQVAYLFTIKCIVKTVSDSDRQACAKHCQLCHLARNKHNTSEK